MGTRGSTGLERLEDDWQKLAEHALWSRYRQSTTILVEIKKS